MFLFHGTFGGLRNLNHEPDLAKALGNMVVVWSNAEQALVNLLHKMANIPYPMATAAYYRIPIFEARVKVLCAMLAEWKTEKHDVRAIERAILKLNALARTRNKYVHRTYLIQNGTGLTFLCNYRAETGPERMEALKAINVINHVNAVERRAVAIWDLVNKPLEQR